MMMTTASCVQSQPDHRHRAGGGRLCVRAWLQSAGGRLVSPGNRRCPHRWYLGQYRFLCLSVCLSVGWSVGRSVCLSIFCLSVSLSLSSLSLLVSVLCREGQSLSERNRERERLRERERERERHTHTHRLCC